MSAWASLAPSGTVAATPELRTFCNPLNLDYNWRKGDFRHGADPVIVP